MTEATSVGGRVGGKGRVRGRVAGLLSGVLLLGYAGPADAADGDVDNLPPVDDQVLNASISSWPVDDEALSRSISSWPVDDEALNRSISSWSLDGSVEELETTSRSSGETVVTLNADILFEFAKASLPSAASVRIATAVAKAPRGSAVSVGGHTDDVGDGPANLRLSAARAKAVAAAVKAARPDLRLTVKGFGETTPVSSNTDAPGRSTNRRVEVRYTG